MKKLHYIDNYLLNPQHKISVALIGVGGTGSQVLTSLGRMNYALQRLGHPGLYVTAYDADIVTEANCGRQLFSQQEIGLNKANVLVTKINMFFGTNWQSKAEMFGEKSKAANIVISCVDTVGARLSIDKNLRNNTHGYDYDRFIYWLDFGNLMDRGQVVIGTAGHSIGQPNKKFCVPILKSVTDLFKLEKVNEKESGPSCSLAEALSKQDLFINSTLAQFGCAMLWKMFTKGVIDVHGIYLNVNTMRTTPIPIK